MSSTVSAAPIDVEIIPSRWLAYYLLAVHVVAGLIVIALPGSKWFTSGALIVLLLSGMETFRACLSLRARGAVVALKRHADGAWQLRLSSGVLIEARLLPDSYVHPELLVLNFRLSNGKRRCVVLLRDSADSTCLRRLRVGLALGARQSID